ncbi:hypothetical protein [Microbulbifer sp. SSSA005]|uniref:hypothetical protein n=2 Tax=unclassified Microbulbifer TaxID=2619833 RepID=UPI0040398824
MRHLTTKAITILYCISAQYSIASNEVTIHKIPKEKVAQENKLLTDLFTQDQSARIAPHRDIDWESLNHEDKTRRIKVLKMLENGHIRTSKDYYHAALIFQHGNKSEDIRLAHALATIAATLAEDKNKANWLKAATWDRLMMNLGRPQWYGTQFVKDDSGNWSLYNIDSDIVSDQQRIDWSVRTLEESKAMEKSLNSKKKSKH